MKKLLILSGKGGTGKTTTSAAFVHYSKAEAFADCDVDAPNLHLVLKHNKEPINKDFICGYKAYVNTDKCIGCGKCTSYCRFDAINIRNNFAVINDIACEGCGVCEYVCPVSAIELKDDISGLLSLYEGNTVFSTAELKMGRGNSGRLVSDVKFNLFYSAYDKDLAIIDGAPGIGCPVLASISDVDLVLIVTEPSLSGFSDLKRLITTINSFNTKFAVCINKYDTSIEKTNEIIQYCKNHQYEFAGTIPFDINVSKALNNGQSIAEIDCEANKALYQIWLKTKDMLNIE